MDIPKLKFSKLWTNREDFPTVEPREEVVRSDMQLLFNEIRDYLNTTLSGAVSTLGDTLVALQGKSGAGRVGFLKTAAIDRENVQDAIECVQAQLVSVSQGGIADGAVTAAKIADGAVGTAAIADDAITADKLAMSAVDTDAIKWGAVDTNRLAQGAVGTKSIANGAVTGEKLGYYAVEERNIKNYAVTGDKIANKTIGSSKIGERAIVTSALVDKAVTTEKIATGAVTGEKVPYKALVTNADLSTEVISSGKVCSVSTSVFRHMRAVGMMFCSLCMTGLAEADVGHDVVVGFSGGEAYQRPGTDAGADGMLRDPAAAVLTARIVYKDVQGRDVWVDSPSVRFNSGGQLVVPIPEGVRASGNCKIYVSGWYMA